MTTVLLDTHVLQWWTAEPRRLSKRAASTIDAADEVAVSSMTWFELAWLAERGRITVTIPVRSWLDRLAATVRTVPITPAIAHAAARLGDPFPGDPADRLIYSTAVEHGWDLVTKDERLRSYKAPTSITRW